MPSIELRPFHRADREQLARLVNAHVGAVLPGVSVSVNAVLSQEEAAIALAQRCVELMRAWRVAAIHADGALPAPALYGVPDCWPHVRGVLEAVGFDAGDHGPEVILLAKVEDLPRGGPAPVPGLTLHRGLGSHATRFSARLEGRVVGFHEVDADLTAGGILSRFAGWGDVWELHVEPERRRQGIASWLVGHSADWLRLAGVERVLDYCATDADPSHLAFAERLGWRELVRTQRGWTFPPP